jgi:hypothetical protein
MPRPGEPPAACLGRRTGSPAGNPRAPRWPHSSVRAEPARHLPWRAPSRGRRAGARAPALNWPRCRARGAAAVPERSETGHLGVASDYRHHDRGVARGETVRGAPVTNGENDPHDGRAKQPLGNGQLARANHPAADGQAVRGEAAGVAAPHVPTDASVDGTEARKAPSNQLIIGHRSVQQVLSNVIGRRPAGDLFVASCSAVAATATFKWKYYTDRVTG